MVNPKAHDDNCFEIKINNICVYFVNDGYVSWHGDAY
jgi:hypothetical protein